MTNKGHLRSHHRANPWLITVLLVCNKNLLWMNHDVGIGVVTTVASAALPPCSRLDRRSCWLNNSLLRPPHSGRHRCRLLGRGYPDVNGYIAISPRPLSSRRSTRRTTRRTKRQRWTCFAWCDRVEMSAVATSSWFKWAGLGTKESIHFVCVFWSLLIIPSDT